MGCISNTSFFFLQLFAIILMIIVIVLNSLVYTKLPNTNVCQPSFEYFLTPNSSKITEARLQCIEEFNGDLLQLGLFPQYEMFHDEIKLLISSRVNESVSLWVGASNRLDRKNFRIMNGTRFRPTTGYLYKWGTNTSGSSSDPPTVKCVNVVRRNYSEEFGVGDCYEKLYGVCEVVKSKC